MSYLTQCCEAEDKATKQQDLQPTPSLSFFVQQALPNILRSVSEFAYVLHLDSFCFFSVIRAMTHANRGSTLVAC